VFGVLALESEPVEPRLEKDYEAQRAASRVSDPMFYQELADAKRKTPLIR
jgi:hypothetical protein